MEKNKKSPRWGCEGWRPIVCVMPKSNGKQAPPLSFAITPTVTREARHPTPSLLRKKNRFAKKKVGSAEKKHAYRKKSYSIVWEACPCLCYRLRHPRSAIPSIDSIALRTPLSDSALNVGAQYFAPAPQCHPARLYSLSFSHQLMRAQNIAPLQEGASLLGSGSATAMLPPVDFAIHGSPASYRRSFFFGEADFFSAKRLFFRAARDVSGAHSVPPWARVEIKLKMSFQALAHSPSHERASALTSPPPDFLFSFIHPSPPSHHPPALLSNFFFGIFGR